jgi:translocation and assembly module TamB
VLGDRVNLRGFGLDAALAGSLNIQQAASGNNLTYGELEITQGSFGIYGQTLSLSDGKLLFLGNYSNPALDIRAVREVQDLTVGVLMNGTLKNIESELFSTPSLPENEILAVLVTGRPFSQLQSSDSDAMVGAIASLGIRQSQSLTNQIADRFGLDTVAITNTGSIDSSTLTVGKYLTPDVFIRYGVGLFDNTSKVAVDYLITDRLTLQAESGEYQSIDFTYRVER